MAKTSRKGGKRQPKINGRPTKLTQELMQDIFTRIERGETLTSICAGEGMPVPRTVYLWLEVAPDLYSRFARAREIGYDAIAEETVRIADETSHDTVTDANGNDRPNSEWISRSKLRVETRLKLLAKWSPKKYGDAVAQQTVNVAVETNVTNVLPEQKRAKIMEARRLAAMSHGGN